ncbi:hypothetical protein O0I10_011057 [Lichtheimia ornata]|uniref:F-box domain-containing protein n=1 Tax=Lichtheimia ornata TaxID=688661 RepID=A0AAD7UTQ9_9FUNG|nr:uncharacterized protein O0I10_011057 [Lichtheimia ornata]KAJ8653307.1 hypothetical protein O0I10_011057 [Lichtheimia ornata]
MNHLPHEVILNIVSQLDPMDCIECFQVSRQWRHLLPLYAARPWRDITVDKDSLHMLSYVHVFGRFVRTARLKLKVLGTMITALDRLTSCSLLEKLELRDVHIMFPYAIQAKLMFCFMRWRLHTFAIINVDAPRVNLVDFILLAANYNIHHVACTSNGEGLFQAQQWKLHPSNLSALISLVIDHPDIREEAIRALLSFTPNLEYLELGSSFRDDILMSSFFTLCPKITHIHLAGDLAMPDEDIYPRDYLQFPTTSGGDQEVYPGLRYYWNDMSQFDQAEYDMLLRYQSTLEHVRVGHYHPSRFTFDWETFTACFLPNTTLKHLVLPLYHQRIGSHTQYEDGYAYWLNACQGLEHLELHSIWYTLGASMMHTLEHHLPSLRRIDMTFHAFHTSFDNPWSGKGGGLFLNQLQLLRALRYRCKHTNTFTELQIGLHGRYNMCDMATILSIVTTIRTLEKLTLRGIGYYDCDDEPDILGFVEGLRFSLPGLKHLRLESFCTVTINIIYAFATLRWLDSLALVDDEITVDGAELLVTSMGNHLKHLYLVNCGLANNKILLQSLAQDYARLECMIHDDDDDA